jgi:hypothetical protein
MSFTTTLFGPGHYFWRNQKPRAWFYRPDNDSSGGVGFCIPGLHVCFMWGRK